MVLTVTPEGQVITVISKADQLLEILMREVLERQLYVIRIKKQLGNVLKFQDMTDLEPLQHEKEAG